MTIQDLISRFDTEKTRFTTSSYSEAQLRTDFLDPLFKLLGWDITNEQGRPTNEREVLVEEGLRASFDENTKKPDYTFRLFAERKFFVEAKKPSVKIERDANAAKQVRRYGFTAKLKISILTNFEYLAIYDCSQIVDESDDHQKGRLKLYHYTEYEQRFEEIQSLIGKRVVYSGEFDAEWENIENQIQRYNIDDLFLRQINDWRLLLGNEIFATNPELDEFHLNDIVQSYINSIVFLRVCEDRHIEVYKTLLNLAESRDFSALIRAFRNADEKYNAGLFSRPLSEEIISNESTAFWQIISQLYYPQSSYSFAVLSSDVLGHIYEIFLGEQLKTERGTVVLRKKPEIEDRDIVTTPTFIVRDILAETVQKFCIDKSDEEILNSKLADIACGSGAFLLETFQLLQDILIDYYAANNPTKIIQLGINNFKLKFDVKKQILLQCLYGIDKDYNAVEACKFGLLLKLLENEDGQNIPFPALPSLDHNIQYGNSLISPTQTNADNRESINPFDFGEVKFNVIIGNPPYLSTENIKKFTRAEFPIYKEIYNSAHKQFDKYFLFIEKAIELLNPNGYLGFIIPSKFSKLGAGKELRRILAEGKNVEKIVSFGANQIFKDKSTYTCILVLNKSLHESISYYEVQNLNNWKAKTHEINYSAIEFSSIDENTWELLPNNLKPAFISIKNQSEELGNLIGSENIYNGIQTSKNNIYVQTISREDDHFYHFNLDGIDWKIEKELTRPYFETNFGNANLNTYRLLMPNSFVIYPYLNQGGSVVFVDMNTLQTNYPEAFRYFQHHKNYLENRSIRPIPQTENEWYRYGRHQCLDKCDVPAKIVVGVLSQGNKYAIDNQRTFISSGGTAGYCMITLPENSPYSVFYIQALLNSKYGEWFASIYGEIFRGGYIARGTKVLKRLPIRKINFDDDNDRSLHNKISDKQQYLIDLQGRIDSNIGNNRILLPLQREFEQRKNELDILLKELFNLGEDDHLIPQISNIYATD